ncbi:MAG: hypothetical protein ACRD3D_02030 [Terriglobia bacterium]
MNEAISDQRSAISYQQAAEKGAGNCDSALKSSAKAAYQGTAFSRAEAE